MFISDGPTLCYDLEVLKLLHIECSDDILCARKWDLKSESFCLYIRSSVSATNEMLRCLLVLFNSRVLYIEYLGPWHTFKRGLISSTEHDIRPTIIVPVLDTHTPYIPSFLPRSRWSTTLLFSLKSPLRRLPQSRRLGKSGYSYERIKSLWDKT